MDLKCPCGTAMLSPTPVIPSHKDSQRGLMKSRISVIFKRDTVFPSKRFA